MENTVLNTLSGSYVLRGTMSCFDRQYYFRLFLVAGHLLAFKTQLSSSNGSNNLTVENAFSGNTPQT